jgi:hypothetical protein
MTFALEVFNSAQAQPEIFLNRNSEALEHQAVYGRHLGYSGPLIWGYWGGRWGGFVVNAGYFTLTVSATNYIVVLRSTGVISASTVITNWNDTTLYARVYQVTTNATQITTFQDHRVGPNGVMGMAPSGGGGLVSPVGVIDGGTGATTTNGARTNLQAAQSGANTDITKINLYGQGGITSNCAVGNSSLSVNSSGYQNVAVGVYALSANTSGFNNTAVGANALYSNVGGNSNTALGYGCLQNGTALVACVAVGHGVMQFTPGARCVAVGNLANQNNTGGAENTAIGHSALNANVSGVGNTALGFEAGTAVTAATGKNTFVGYQAGSTLTTGANNTIIGNTAAPSAVSVSNEITLGNASITTLRCQVTSITALSDARDKTDIQSLAFGLDFINALNPVSFIWAARDGSKVGKAASGFLAQDLARAQETFGAQDVLDLVSHNDPERLEARYGHLIPVLVRAVQELSVRIAVLEHGRHTNFNQEQNP